MERLAGRIILLWGWPRALMSFAVGALAVLAQPPFDFFVVGFVSFPVLVWLLDGATGSARPGLRGTLRAAFGVGWWFGFGYFLAGLWWIGSAVLVEADSFAWALPFAIVGIPALLAFFFGFATATARLLWSGGLGRIFALAAAFGLAEWLRTFVLTGFPWNPVGFAAMPVPLAMQSAHLIGTYGMNALAVLVFAMPALLAAHRHRTAGLAIVLVLIGVHLGYGFYRLGTPDVPSDKRLTLRIVQPNVDMAQKWDQAAEDEIFKKLLRLSGEPPQAGAGKPALVLWPETAVPFFLTERPDALAAIGGLLEDGQMLLTGAVRGEGAGAQAGSKYYNSVVAIDAGGAIVDAIDKVHLVPFGEYVPFADWMERFGISQFVLGLSDFEPGTERHAIRLPGEIRAVPFICYEIIFPDMVASDAGSADFIVNVTNDAWFGRTPGPFQHLRQAQVRAVESGLPVVRAANTGISAVIDRRGRIVDALGLGAEGTLDATVELRATPAPLAAPNLVGLATIALFLATALAFRLRNR